MKLGIDDRVDATADKDAFITLKDHKPNFANKPTCRLINPTKSEIDEVRDRQSQQKDPLPHQQHDCEKTQLQKMEKHRSRNQLVHIYQKQTTLQLHLFRHRRVLSIHQPRPPKQSTRLRLRLWQHHHRRKKYYNPRKKLHLNPQAPTLAKERQHNIRRNNGKLRRRRNMWTRGKLSALPTPGP